MITIELQNDKLTDQSQQLLLAYNIIMFPELGETYEVNMSTDVCWDYLPATGDKHGYAIGKLKLHDGHEITLYTALDAALNIIEASWRLSKDKASVSISDTAAASPLQELEIKSQVAEPAKSDNAAKIDNTISHLLYDTDDIFSDNDIMEIFSNDNDPELEFYNSIPETFEDRDTFKKFMGCLSVSLETAVMDCCLHFKTNDLHFAVPQEGGEEIHLSKENGYIVRKYDDDRNDTFFIDLPYAEQVACVSRLMDLKEFGE